MKKQKLVEILFCIKKFEQQQNFLFIFLLQTARFALSDSNAYKTPISKELSEI